MKYLQSCKQKHQNINFEHTFHFEHICPYIFNIHFEHVAAKKEEAKSISQGPSFLFQQQVKADAVI